MEDGCCHAARHVFQCEHAHQVPVLQSPSRNRQLSARSVNNINMYYVMDIINQYEITTIFLTLHNNQLHTRTDFYYYCEINNWHFQYKLNFLNFVFGYKLSCGQII
jgi:hypothetical protein